VPYFPIFYTTIARKDVSKKNINTIWFGLPAKKNCGRIWAVLSTFFFFHQFPFGARGEPESIPLLFTRVFSLSRKNR
jgi:hypothetical protein